MRLEEQKHNNNDDNDDDDDKRAMRAVQALSFPCVSLEHLQTVNMKVKCK